jgi:hypothetical protein
MLKWTGGVTFASEINSAKKIFVECAKRRCLLRWLERSFVQQISDNTVTYYEINVDWRLCS